MEKTLMSSPVEEEHADKMLTPWEKELEMLEDWLNHPEPVDDCHERQSCRFWEKSIQQNCSEISARKLNR
jgi:hypothetical protein